MKNKKAFLLAEETVKIVIALIALSFLIYFLISLYLSGQEDKNLELAKDSLQHLTGEINAGVTEVEIYHPYVRVLKWSISSWPDSKNRMPLSCSNLGWESCLCICDHSNVWLIKNCENVNVGICMENKNKFVVGKPNSPLPIVINNPPIKLNIDYEKKIISEIK